MSQNTRAQHYRHQDAMGIHVKPKRRSAKKVERTFKWKR